MTPRLLVIDACSLLNLLATGRALELVMALGAVLLSSEKTREETRFLCGPAVPDDEEQRPTKLPVDLSPLIDRDLLQVRALGEDAADALVDCATYLRDADASVVALAATLSVPLVSDDGRVRKVARKLYPELGLLSTLQLLREAAERAGIRGEPLRELARNLHERGNFDPPRSDPERSWFEALLSHRTGD